MKRIRKEGVPLVRRMRMRTQDEDADARRAEAVNAETLRVEDQEEMVMDAD